MPGHIHQYAGRLFVFVVLLAAFSAADAEKIASIIIDDLGNNYEQGQTVVNFPAALTLSILPQTTFATTLANQAHANDKEVMLHLPLQSVEHHKHSPGTLTLHMTRHQFDHSLKQDLASVPHVRGINNHMGSLLSQHPGHMDWLMAEISTLDNIYFIDSRTSHKSVIADTASHYRIPNLVRDVFLDPDAKPETIRKQFERFIDVVKRKGYAIAIAHPYPTTLSFLRNNLDKLAEHGIELVPVSKLLELRENEKYATCSDTTCSRL